jgi:hypothetical protein
MIQVHSRQCKEEGCSKIATYNYPGARSLLDEIDRSQISCMQQTGRRLYETELDADTRQVRQTWLRLSASACRTAAVHSRMALSIWASRGYPCLSFWTPLHHMDPPPVRLHICASLVLLSGACTKYTRHACTTRIQQSPPLLSKRARCTWYMPPCKPTNLQASVTCLSIGNADRGSISRRR